MPVQAILGDNPLAEGILVSTPLLLLGLLVLLMLLWKYQVRQQILQREALERRLRHNEQHLLDSQSIAKIGSWEWDRVHQQTLWSPELYHITGASLESFQPEQESLFQFVHPDDRAQLRSLFDRLMHGKRDELSFEHRIVRADGSLRHVHSYAYVTRNKTHEVQRLLGVVHDNTGQKEIELALRDKTQALQSILDNAPIGIWLQDIKGKLLFVNRAYCEALGISEKKFLSVKHYAALYEPEVAEHCMASDMDALSQEGPQISHEKMPYADGSVHDLEVIKVRLSNEHGMVTGLIGLSLDITERKHAEEELLHQAYYDSLTGLPNRTQLLEQLSKSLAQAQRHQYQNALLFFDLDNFKTINDTLGHDVGDLLLKDVGERLRHVVRQEDSVARLGGDEFVVILNDLGKDHKQAVDQANQTAHKIKDTLSLPYRIEGREHHITLSIGIDLFPENGEQIHDILKHADTAMYRAKEAGRNTIRFFARSMQAAAEERFHLQHLLRQAIGHDELSMYYQPQYTHDGKLLGVESLLRWNHPQRGNISPERFIPIAEESGQIIDIGTWVLQQACRALRSWQDSGIDKLPVSINVSPRQFHQADFVEQFQRIVHQEGVSPRLIELELTETILAENLEELTAKMTALKAMGVQFAIDDFGTGYSSLSYLKRLPLDRLKIDQSFVRGITSDPSDALIVETIIAMATHLGLEVIAEGVETRAQMQFLLKRGCDAFQGFYYSRPLSQEKFTEYLGHADLAFELQARDISG